MKAKSKLDVALSAHSELLIRTISNLVYMDPPQVPQRPLPLHDLYRRLNVELETKDSFDRRKAKRIEGHDWPAVAHSMIGYKRLRNLADCVLDVVQNKIEGDLIETGVWRGGSCILMQGLLRATGETHRNVFVADSFEGLPPPDADAFPMDANDNHHKWSDQLGVSLERVEENFAAYGFLDENVKFLKGWFKDTLPRLEAEKFAIVRLDGDMYESTIQAIEALYPKLSEGGYLIVDDFGAIPGCRGAIADYRRAHGIKEELVKIDFTGVFWQKAAT